MCIARQDKKALKAGQIVVGSMAKSRLARAQRAVLVVVMKGLLYAGGCRRHRNASRNGRMPVNGPVWLESAVKQQGKLAMAQRRHGQRGAGLIVVDCIGPKRAGR